MLTEIIMMIYRRGILQMGIVTVMGTVEVITLIILRRRIGVEMGQIMGR